MTRKIGFRRVELIQDPLEGQKGTSFYFKVNNKRIFIGGSNWIPIDTVQSRGTEAKFRKWIELLVSLQPLLSSHLSPMIRSCLPIQH